MAGIEDIPSYIFGGTSGTPSYEELLRRRQVAVANAMRGRKAPTTLGEGMTYLGEAIGDRMEGGRLSEMERAWAEREDRIRGTAPGSGYRSGAVAAPPPVTGAVPFSGAGAGNLSGVGVRDRIAALVQDRQDGAPQEVAQANPTWSVAEAPPATPTPGGLSDLVERRRNALGGIETGGRRDPYATVVDTGRGDSVYGRYAIKGSNIPEWTQAALGQRLTPRDFLNSKEAQDTVFDHRFGQYANRYGEEGAARAWFAGERGMNNPGATDRFGRLNVASYGQDYLNRLGGAGSSPAPSSVALPPIRVASLGGAGGTMSDALPPEAMNLAALSEPVVTPATLAPPPAADENPPTPSDIKPMPVRTTVAQAGPGIIPGSVAGLPGLPSAGVLAGPTGGPAGAAPAMPPSREPIPPTSIELPSDPGPEPTRPKMLGPSPQQQYWEKYVDHPNVSPALQAHAKRQIEAEEVYRRELNAARTNDYTDTRERWQKLKDERDKAVREQPTKIISQHLQRLQIEAGIAEAEKRPYDLAKLKVDIDKAKQDLDDARYKAGLPRVVEERTAAAKATIAEQEAAAGKAPPHLTQDGQLIEYDQASKQWKVVEPKALPATGGPPNIPGMTAEQGKDLALHDKARIALDQMARIPDGDKILAEGLKQELIGKVPYFGNALMESRYRAMRNAANSLVQAHLRQLSGAAYSASELTSTHNNLIPIYGDDALTMRQKAEQRNSVASGLYLGLGKARPLADYAIKERAAADAATQAKMAAEMPPNPEVGKIYKKVDPTTKRIIQRHWTGSRWEED